MATSLRVRPVAVVVAAAADRDQAGSRAGHRVPVAAAERLLPGDVLRDAGHPHGDGSDRCGRDQRRPAEPDGHADRAGSGAADGQRGRVRAVPARRPPAAADRVLAGHGVLGRAGGAHLPACTGRARRLRRLRIGGPDGRPGAGASAPVGRHRRVRLQRLGRRDRVPVDAGRRTAARLGAGRGRRSARRLRVRANVRRPAHVPVRRRARSRRRGRPQFRGHGVCDVRGRLADVSPVRARQSARDAGQTVQGHRAALRRPSANVIRPGRRHAWLAPIPLVRSAGIMSSTRHVAVARGTVLHWRDTFFCFVHFSRSHPLSLLHTFPRTQINCKMCPVIYCIVLQYMYVHLCRNEFEMSMHSQNVQNICSFIIICMCACVMCSLRINIVLSNIGEIISM